jgi:putative MATE family efflux protein
MKNKLYDASKIDWDNLMFSTKELWMLLIPIMVEQMLNSLMGMADTMMVSNVGSVAMSAVSLVDSINTLVIQMFAALATGAAIICSHYLGKGDEKGANKAARQIFLTVIVISVTLTAIGLIFCKPLLRLIFGAVEPEVMEDSIIYFLITASSYPFIALFNAGGAFYRAGGNSKFPMKISIISNVLNILGNAILIFGCNLGVAGAAISTLISRVFCAVVVLYFLRKPKQEIVLNQYYTIRPDFPLIGKILAIGVPAGVENGMFQFGKLAIQSTVSTLGTQAIAAMTVIFENVNGIAAIAVGIGLMTVAGQAFGAGRKEEARYYILKLTGYAEIVLIISCLVTFVISRPVMHLAGMEPESMELCYQMLIVITIAKPILWALSFIPPYGLRAAGDVKFSMITATCTMWFCRVALAIYLIRFQGFGPIAVWIGMFADWGIRSIIFSARFLSGKWMGKHVI